MYAVFNMLYIGDFSNTENILKTTTYLSQAYSLCSFRYIKGDINKSSVKHRKVLQLNLVGIIGILQHHAILHKFVEDGIWHVMWDSINVHPGVTVLLKLAPQSLKKQPGVRRYVNIIRGVFFPGNVLQEPTKFVPM